LNLHRSLHCHSPFETWQVFAKQHRHQPGGGSCLGGGLFPAMRPGGGGSFSGGYPSGIAPEHARSSVSRDNALGSSIFPIAGAFARILIARLIVTVHSSTRDAHSLRQRDEGSPREKPDEEGNRRAASNDFLVGSSPPISWAVAARVQTPHRPRSPAVVAPSPAGGPARSRRRTLGTGYPSARALILLSSSEQLSPPDGSSPSSLSLSIRPTRDAHSMPWA